MKTSKKSKKKKIAKKAGRKSVITPEVEKKLEDIFKIGGTIAEATSYAGIGERTYYSNIEMHEKFQQKMEAAQHFADVAAKHVVVDKIVKEKDDSNARWWLEKRQFKDTSQPSVQLNQFNFGDAAANLQNKFMSFLKSNPQVTVEGK